MAKNNPQDEQIDDSPIDDPAIIPQDDATNDVEQQDVDDEQDELGFKLTELTMDLQRTRADFENYRKRVDSEKQAAREAGQSSAILKLLPVIDNIERAIGHVPDDLAENAWAQSVAGLTKQLDKSLDGLNLKRIDANPGTAFDPEVHEAIQFNEDAEGEHEVIAEELQAGYTLNGHPIRHAMVKVTRQ